MKFTKPITAVLMAILATAGTSLPSKAADLITGPYKVVKHEMPNLPVFAGRVKVIDGRTVFFPRDNATVKFMDIDACELPQWTFDGKIRKPVPCGGFAKAWLKRTIGNNPIVCMTATFAPDGTPMAYCFNGKQDLGLEMLRVGWARISTPHAQSTNYHILQKRAQDARYGMWKDYILDMEEWRKRAIDKTVSRQPIADYNLLIERKGIIGPAIADLEAKPKRKDR